MLLAATGLCLWLLNLSLPETKPVDCDKKGSVLNGFWSVITDRIGSSIILLGFVQYFTFYHFLVFMPGLLSDYYHLSAGEKGFVFLPMSLLIIVGSFFGSRLQERFEPKKFLVFSSSFNVVATILFIALVSINLPLLIMSISLFGLCLGFSLPVQTTLLSRSFQHNRATAMGTYNLFRFLGMAFGPVIGTFFYNIGSLLEFTFAAFLFTCIILYASRQFTRFEQRKAA